MRLTLVRIRHRIIAQVNRNEVFWTDKLYTYTYSFVFLFLALHMYTRL